MTPPKWLVAPCDVGPSYPGFEDLLQHMESKNELLRMFKAWRATHPDYVAAPTYAPDAPKLDFDVTRCLP